MVAKSRVACVLVPQLVHVQFLEERLLQPLVRVSPQLSSRTRICVLFLGLVGIYVMLQHRSDGSKNSHSLESAPDVVATDAGAARPN